MKKAVLAVAALFALLVVAGFVTGAIQLDIPAEVAAERYASESSRFLELADGSVVHVRDEGRPDGPPLVLIHGSYASLHTWEPWVAELGGDFRIISMDMPGHGLTGPSSSGDYTYAAMVRTVDAVTRRLGVERFALAGSSWGGGIAWHYAVAHPERVEKLILVDATGFPAEGPRPLAYVLTTTPVVRMITLFVTPIALVESSLKEAAADDAVVTEAMVTRYRDLILREGNRKAALTRAKGIHHAESLHRLETLPVPTLVLWGREDLWIPVDHARRFHEAIPDSTLRIYDDVGHVPMEEIPRKSAEDVLMFLTQPSRSETPPHPTLPHNGGRE